MSSKDSRWKLWNELSAKHKHPTTDVGRKGGPSLSSISVLTDLFQSAYTTNIYNATNPELYLYTSLSVLP